MTSIFAATAGTRSTSRQRYELAGSDLFALLPLPYSVVRLAVLRHPPKMVPYQITVGMGRLPRYLLTISLWPNLGLPPSSCIVLLGLGAAYAGIQSLRSRSRQELSAESNLS